MTNDRRRLVDGMSAAMAERLSDEKNASKGDRWKKVSTILFISFLQEEVAELIRELQWPQPNEQRVREEAADVAVVASMLADRFGAYSRERE